ncbi:MAG TPA: hypothetical protein PLR06_02150 [Cyclobacteriaceae bacterium]|nr:hypothetical protein [Cyclobacteriaceae bacterium]
MKVRPAVIIFALLLLTGTASTFAQSTHDILVSGGLDLIKSDNIKLFEKAQIGLEGNYFIQRHFAAGIGAELWTKQKSSFVLGARWYADDHLFFRIRGLIGSNDASAGIGWSKALNEKWRFEGIGDFYFNQSDFALRAGVGYIIRK